MKRLAATLAVGAALLVAGPGVAQAAPSAQSAPAASATPAGTVTPMVTTLYGPFSSNAACNADRNVRIKTMSGPWGSCTKGDTGWYYVRW